MQDLWHALTVEDFVTTLIYGWGAGLSWVVTKRIYNFSHSAFTGWYSLNRRRRQQKFFRHVWRGYKDDHQLKLMEIDLMQLMVAFTITMGLLVGIGVMQAFMEAFALTGSVAELNYNFEPRVYRILGLIPMVMLTFVVMHGALLKRAIQYSVKLRSRHRNRSAYGKPAGMRSR